MFSTGVLVFLSRRLPRPREYSAFARLARCVCLTRGDCRDLGNAQHSLGWRVAYYVQAVLRTKPSPRDFVTRSWARSHDYATITCRRCFAPSPHLVTSSLGRGRVRISPLSASTLAAAAQCSLCLHAKKAPAHYVREPFHS